MFQITGVVGVVQLGHTLDLGVFDGRTLLVELRLGFELHPVHDALHHPACCRLRRNGSQSELK